MRGINITGKKHWIGWVGEQQVRWLCQQKSVNGALFFELAVASSSALKPRMISLLIRVGRTPTRGDGLQKLDFKFELSALQTMSIFLAAVP
jgi:hypothetical protein